MIQRDLDFTAQHSRTTDPATSMRAASKARGLAARHCQIIRDVLLIVGKPMSSEEISDRCELGYVQVARRMSDLRRDGKVRASSGPKHTNRGGCEAVRWELVPETRGQ